MVESASGSNVVEETSPDLLKNTPSNIRRLADEIEQCEGRQKYLAHTVSPSDGGDVRWYFCKVPLALNEPAAAVPHTEIVGHGDYFRFGMRDSLAIEALFLQREEELLSLWWKEFAECSEGPSELPSKLNSMSIESSPVNSESAEEDAVEERVGVPVKGGLYEVYLAKRHCFPVYWNGENRRVLRGHWFACKGGLDWLPLREDVAEQLEYAYRCKVWRRRSFQPSGLYAARVDLQGSTLGLHALFTGEDDTWEAWLSVDASGFSGVLRFGGNGVKLRRGYASSQSPKPTQDELRQKKEEEMDDYCSQVPVRHLVFMVHGIGQRLEKSNLVDDVGDFRHVTASLAERHLSPYQLGTQRVLFIPCQWRKGLKLGGEAAVDKITLDGVRGFRTMLSATVHDVLYYMSPIYCQAIIDSVSNQLNRLYLKFLKRNPGYNGKVSIYGHSLGSVLSYDILCHQEILSSPFPMEWMYTGANEKKVSFPDKSEVSLDQNVTAIVDDESLVSDRSKNTVNLLGNDIMEVDQSCSGLVEECTEFLCHPVSPPALSDSDEAAVNSVDIKQHDDRNDLGPSEQDMTKIEELESDKDKMIRSLREEIDLLTAKIRALDCWSGPEGKKGQETNTINQSETEFPKESDSHKNYTPCIKYTKLAFKVDTFFAVGSPLGVFLSLRNVRIGIGKGQEYWEEEKINEEMPACRQMFNIFHPFDPVAYRIEPLVCKEYVNKRPIIIPYHRGGKRLHIGFQEFTEGVASHSHAFVNHIHSARVKVLTFCESRNNNNEEEGTHEAQVRDDRSYGSIMMEKLTGSEDGRIDHVLQDKTFRHPYISAIGAHTNYWRDPDTALFILHHLYRDIPEDTHSPGGSLDGNSKHESDEGYWYGPNEEADEETPLTFADSVFLKKFSRRARRILKHQVH
ncbi:phospholipase SGR2-like [Ipomoea triloba]|uniref:phospholipase SGR2-like n=1 Tax=Ipomoea triloba TaxID=35885 RepID=UPI00125E5C58|nr:phospholipase SGR2-like [Ipomoea triloba]XP_031123194.1 phospholipase SGR2-like [Ipomoea triloba]XP_031123203.1 phospholipase SGR2-like [Ipomoea triloba]